MQLGRGSLGLGAHVQPVAQAVSALLGSARRGSGGSPPRRRRQRTWRRAAETARAILPFLFHAAGRVGLGGSRAGTRGTPEGRSRRARGRRGPAGPAPAPPPAAGACEPASQRAAAAASTARGDPGVPVGGPADPGARAPPGQGCIMATLACRVQFLDDTDPFNSTNFPEPSRPPLFTFREDLALGTQLAGVHRLLRAPHKVRPGAGGLGPRDAVPAAGRAGVGSPRASWAGRSRETSAQGQTSPLSVRQRGPGARRLARVLLGQRGGQPRVPARSGGGGAADWAEQVRRQSEAGWRRFPTPRRSLGRVGGVGLGRRQSVPAPGRAPSGARKEPGPRGALVLRRGDPSDARDETSQASGAAAGGRATLATKHASRGHLSFLPCGAPRRASPARYDSARSSPFSLEKAGGLGDLGGAVAVGGGAGARRGGARTEPQMSVPWEEWLLSPPDSFFFNPFQGRHLAKCVLRRAGR